MSRTDSTVAVPIPTVPGGLNDPGCALTVVWIYADRVGQVERHPPPRSWTRTGPRPWQSRINSIRLGCH